ncbi:hypothetical protein [Actinomadura meridiana]
MRSAVRGSLWPQAPSPRHAGYTAWRLVPDPGRRLAVGGESWGRGARLDIAPLPDGRVYVFGVANAPEGQRSPDRELTEMRRRFNGWHDPIPELLAQWSSAPAVLLRDWLLRLTPSSTMLSALDPALGWQPPTSGEGRVNGASR